MSFRRSLASSQPTALYSAPLHAGLGVPHLNEGLDVLDHVSLVLLARNSVMAVRADMEKPSSVDGNVLAVPANGCLGG